MARAPTDIRSLARQHTALAISKLAHIARYGESETAAVLACNALLDRGWGKAQQTVTHEHEDIRVVVRHIVRGETIAERPLKTINHVTNVTSQDGAS